MRQTLTRIFYLSATLFTLFVTVCVFTACSAPDGETPSGEATRSSETMLSGEAAGFDEQTEVPSPDDDDNVFYTFTDTIGREITLSTPPERVAVLMGSYAETWILSGGADTLVGVTQDAFTEREMNLPDDIAVLGFVNEPDAEALFAAAPDFVILSAEVDTHTILRESLDAAGIPAALFRVNTFADYLRMLDICTDITGRKDLYETNGLSIRDRIDAVRESVPDGTPPKILLLRASSTGVKARNSDNVAGEILRDLNCRNIADTDAGILDDLQMEAILTADPDYIFALLHGSKTEQARENLDALLESDPAWGTLTAVREDRVMVLDKNLFHYKPNHRWAESYETLARILYPDVYP